MDTNRPKDIDNSPTGADHLRDLRSCHFYRTQRMTTIGSRHGYSYQVKEFCNCSNTRELLHWNVCKHKCWITPHIFLENRRNFTRLFAWCATLFRIQYWKHFFPGIEILASPIIDSKASWIASVRACRNSIHCTRRVTGLSCSSNQGKWRTNRDGQHSCHQADWRVRRYPTIAPWTTPDSSTARFITSYSICVINLEISALCIFWTSDVFHPNWY